VNVTAPVPSVPAPPAQASTATASLLHDLGRGEATETRPLVRTVLWAGATYGAFMGSYACDSLDRLKMVTYAALKVPLLIFSTTAICLPGFFVFNTVAGLRAAFARSVRAIAAGQAASAIALASLAPFARFAYASGIEYRRALALHSVLFAVATAAGHAVLVRHYRRLIEEEPRHRAMLRLWVTLYAFVGMQMGWTLRPFLGTRDMPVTFFRDEPFSNAYIVIAQLFF
jgi:hypothetical protein